MYEIHEVQKQDRSFWRSLDAHLSKKEWERIIRDHRGYVLLEKKEPIGLLRYNLFWDEIPFCNMLIVTQRARGMGYGGKLLAHWEGQMLACGYKMVLTSTRVDESAQHFYRRLGYRDCGGLCLDVPGDEHPMELFLFKELKKAEGHFADR